MRLNESKSINKSLFFLTQVIFLASKGGGLSSLIEGKKAKHIPFRNSPLTKILRSSFGGNSRTLLILNISPSLHDFEISLSTLRFGRCAKKIENVVKTNIMAGYNKEALQKIVNSYEKKIAKYKEQVKEVKEKQEKMMEFMKKFGVFSEDFMKKMMEQVGDAKGGMKQLMGMWGGRNVDYDRLRRMRADLMESAGSGFEDGRVYIDVLAKQPGIIYRLNEALFDDKEENEKKVEDVNAKFNLINLRKGLKAEDAENSQMEGEEGGKEGEGEEGEDEDEYFYMEINGEMKRFEKFVVYNEEGDMVYQEDIFDEEGNLDRDLFLFDHFYNRVEVDQLFDSENQCKLKSKFKKKKTKTCRKCKESSKKNSQKNANLLFKDRQNMIFKELKRVIGTKWPGEVEAASLKNEEFLSREVFEKFKEKLDREEVLEKTCKVFFEELRSYLEERDSRRDKLAESILKPQVALLTTLVDKLIHRLSDTLHEMEFYERPKRIKHITKEELKEYSNRLKRMVGVYQKEKMRREIVSELRGDNPNLVVNLGELDEDMIGLGNVKQELAMAEKAKEQFQEIVDKNILNLVNWCKKKNFMEVLNVVESEIGKEVDKIYDDNYNIQSFFYNYSSSVLSNSEMLEKKVMFLTEQLVKKFVRREDYAEEGQRLKPFKVWKRRLSLRNLKEKYKRPMFQNMDALAQSDVMFLYKNIQNKLDNFMKVQKDVNRLGTIGNIDDIKGIITSFDQNKGSGEQNDQDEIYSEKNGSIQEEDEEDNQIEIVGENEEYEEEEQEEEMEEEVYEKPKIKKKKKGKKKKKKTKKNKENNQINIPVDSNFNTIDYDPNLEKIYGVKTSSFVNKYTPYMDQSKKPKNYPQPSSTNEIQYNPEAVRQRGYQTFSHKSKTYEHMEQEIPQEPHFNNSDYEDEYEEDSVEHDYEENSQEDIESINDSDVSDVSNPYNINMKNMKMSHKESDSEDETSIQGRNKRRGNSNDLKENDLGAYYSNIAKGN